MQSEAARAESRERAAAAESAAEALAPAVSNRAAEGAAEAMAERRERAGAAAPRTPEEEAEQSESRRAEAEVQREARAARTCSRFRPPWGSSGGVREGTGRAARRPAASSVVCRARQAAQSAREPGKEKREGGERASFPPPFTSKVSGSTSVYSLPPGATAETVQVQVPFRGEASAKAAGDSTAAYCPTGKPRPSARRRTYFSAKGTAGQENRTGAESAAPGSGRTGRRPSCLRFLRVQGPS